MILKFLLPLFEHFLVNISKQRKTFYTKDMRIFFIDHTMQIKNFNSSLERSINHRELFIGLIYFLLNGLFMVRRIFGSFNSPYIIDAALEVTVLYGTVDSNIVSYDSCCVHYCVH